MREFPNDPKHADIVTVHKKKSKTSQTNLMPISILSNLSKLYGKVMHKQLYQNFETILSLCQCGFVKRI